MDVAQEQMLQKLEAESRSHAWQKHRMFCLELAVKLGAKSTEQAIDAAEKFSGYILRPAGKEKS